MKPYLNTLGFFEGEINPEYAHPDFAFTIVDAAAPTELPPRFFSWLWNGTSWELSTDNRGRLWYLESNTDTHYVGKTPTDIPPNGYLEFISGIDKVITLQEILDKAKAIKWAELKKDRATAEYAGFTWDSSVFDTDQVSQGRISSAVTLATLDASFTVNWTLADNSIRTLSAADMIAFGQALGSHIEAIFVHGQDLRTQLEMATTLEGINALNW